jgi:hypothetical protein
MKIVVTNIKDESNANELNTSDLLNHLCEAVLSMTDDEIKTSRQKLSDLKKSAKNKNQALKEVIKSHKDKTSLFAKERQLGRVLSRIDTLNKEGTLRSNKRTYIISILPKLNNYSFSKLSELDEQLSIF